MQNNLYVDDITTQEKTVDDSNSVNILGLHWTPTKDKIMLADKPPLLTSDILITKERFFIIDQKSLTHRDSLHP